MCSGVQLSTICMSSSVTSHVIDNIANDYDDAVIAEPLHIQVYYGPFMAPNDNCFYYHQLHGCADKFST